MPLLLNIVIQVFLAINADNCWPQYGWSRYLLVFNKILLLIIGRGSRPFLPIGWRNLQIQHSWPILCCLGFLRHQQARQSFLSLGNYTPTVLRMYTVNTVSAVEPFRKNTSLSLVFGVQRCGGGGVDSKFFLPHFPTPPAPYHISTVYPPAQRPVPST